MATQVHADDLVAQLRTYLGLEAIYAGFERAALELEAARAAPICLEGCGLCCEINTPYSWSIEAEHVIASLLGIGKLATALDSCESWLLDRVAGLTYYGPRQPRTQDDRQRVLEEVRLAARQPCPFLDAEKRCVIHDVRPLACRAYGVTRLPSQFDCRAPLAAHETREARMRYGGPGEMALRQQVARFLNGLRLEQRAGYFLPTALLRQARPAVFQNLQDRFATAKMIAFAQSPAMIWQEQLDQQWREMGVR